MVKEKAKIKDPLSFDDILPHAKAKQCQEINPCNASMFSFHQAHGIIDITDLSKCHDSGYNITCDLCYLKHLRY